MTIAENVALVRGNMERAAQAAGRDPKEILLLAATKMNDAHRVREAIAAGVDLCGENRVQEMLEKQAQGAYEGVPLHFIGHLQKNKVKQGQQGAALPHLPDGRKPGSHPGCAAGGEHRRRERQVRLFPGGDPRCSGLGLRSARDPGPGADGHSADLLRAGRKPPIFSPNAAAFY